jgi:hypothetical protein
MKIVQTLNDKKSNLFLSAVMFFLLLAIVLLSFLNIKQYLKLTRNNKPQNYVELTYKTFSPKGEKGGNILPASCESQGISGASYHGYIVQNSANYPYNQGMWLYSGQTYLDISNYICYRNYSANTVFLPSNISGTYRPSSTVVPGVGRGDF